MMLNSATGQYEVTLQNTGVLAYYVRVVSKSGSSADSKQYSTFLYCVT